MIFITGDCHQEFKKFNMKNFPIQRELTKKDYVILCGDFGVIWDSDPESKCEKHILDELENRNFTTLFVDGNHENFDRLNAYPIEEWHGGKVHKIRASVIHLMRGQVFDIEGKKIFTFGGAQSHDIEGGVLDPDDINFKEKTKRARREYLPYRVKNVSWWEQELANETEMIEGLKNLEKVGNVVDYIITHCAPSKIQDILPEAKSRGANHDSQTDYLDKIHDSVSYDKWYFGHYHCDKTVNDKDILLYDKVIQLGNKV